jgi:hypothetical protein
MQRRKTKKKSETDSDEHADESQEQIAPSDTKPTHKEPTNKTGGGNIKQRWWRDERWRHPQVIINGILAVVGIFAASIYLGQLHQMKKATRASRVAAIAARDSVNVAKEANALDRRPWVTVAGVKLDKALTKGDEKITIRVTWSNSGRTPAFDAALNARVFVSSITLKQEEMEFSGPIKDDPRGSRIIIPPQSGSATSIKESDETISDFQIKDVKEGNSLIYVIGNLEYIDQISNAKHKASFCYWFSGGELAAGTDFFACIHGNTAD